MMINEGIITTCKTDKTCNNIITDGNLTFTYSELLPIFNKFDQYFELNKIDVESCIAYPCSNNIPNAIFLLWLIYRERSVILLPPLIKNSTSLHLPQFCEHIVTIDNIKNSIDINSPDNYINITCYEHFSKEINVSKKNGIIYIRTSGSTASPKLVCHSMNLFSGNVQNCVERFKLTDTDRITIPVPIFHLYGFGAAFLPAVIAGASIDLQENTNLIKYLDREREFNPNKAYLTPGLCDMFIEARKSERFYTLSVTSGDRISEDNFIRFEKKFGKLLNLYGSTEMGATASSNPDDSVDIRSKGFLKPLNNVSQKIVKIKENVNLDGMWGEIHFNHKYGFIGYINMKGESIQWGDENPEWFPSKDMATEQSNGYFIIKGRCDNCVNRDGHLLPLSEVESSMERINGISRVVTIVHGDSKRGKSIMAFCVAHKGVKLNSSDIKTECFNLLPGFGIPDRFFVLKEFPLLANGKIDRQSLLKSII